jgi:hypothetical protein
VRRAPCHKHTPTALLLVAVVLWHALLSLRPRLLTWPAGRCPQDNTPGINASTFNHWGVPRAPATKEPNSPEATAALCDASLAYQKMWGWADADSETPAAAMCEIGRKQQWPVMLNSAGSVGGLSSGGAVVLHS